MAEEPLSEDQLKVLQEIGKLQGDQQRTELNRFLKTLQPGQVEWLRKRQSGGGGGGGGCIFCSISEKKVPASSVYEDASVLAVLDIRPATKGHVLVIPRKHAESLVQLEDDELGHFFGVVKRLGQQMIEKLKAEGFNVYLADGGVAGQAVPHLGVHVIPRYQNDKVEFTWQPLQLSPQEIEAVKMALTDSVVFERVVRQESAPAGEQGFKRREMLP